MCGGAPLTPSESLWFRIGQRLCPGSCTRTHRRSVQGSAAMDQLHGQRPPVLVTTVDIGDGESEQIELREGDDPKVRTL